MERTKPLWPFQLCAIFWLSVACLIGEARADYQPGAIVAPQTVANMASITGKPWGPAYQNLYLTGYRIANDGGEGAFAYSSTPCTPDGGSCVQSLDGSYYVRTNLNGDIRQFGATSGSIYDYLTHGTGATDISPVLTALTTAMSAHSLTLINTNAISVYMATSFSIPANMIVNCGSAIGQPDTGLWYNNTPSTIYEAHGTSLHLAGRNSGLQNCRVYSQPVVATKPVGAQQVQAMNALMVSNGDTLVYCDDDNCNFNNVELMGGDTCLETASADASVLDNVDTDCNVNFYVHSIGGTVKWSKTQGDVYLNKNLTPKREDFTITSITVGAGNTCKVTVTPQSGAALADLAYATYIYISSLSDGPSICEGRWHVQNVDTVAGTFELVGSVVGNPTGGPSTFGHWANDSSVIYISDGTNVANGTSINGLASSGIPNATMVETPWQLPPPVGPWIADTGAANAYVANATSDLQPCTLQDSLNVSFTAAHSNTAASTLNITLRTDAPAGCGGGATGPVAIVRNDGTDLQANDITANANELVHYCVDLSTQCVASAVNKWVLIQPRVVLDTNKTTAAQSSNVAITFLGAVCSGGGCGTAPEASIIYATRVDAGASAGGVAAGGTGAATCYMIGGPHDKRINSDGDTVAGFQDVNAFCYDHSRFFHFQNANEAWVGDFGTDSHGGDDDPNPIILLVDGDSNNIHVVGRKAGKGGRSILVNLARPDSPDRGCVTWLGAAVAATKGFLPVSTVEQGCLLMVAGVTNSGGVNLVGHFANAASYSSVYQPNVTNYYEDEAAIAGACTAGSTFAGGQTCGTLGVADPNGRARRVSITTDTVASAADCNTFYNNGANDKLTLPSSPPAGCTFSFSSSLFKLYVIFPGAGLALPGWANDPITTLVICCSGIQDSFFQITWDGTKWQPTSYSRTLYDVITPRDASVIMHGQVYVSHNSGSSRFELVPQNGPGGIMTNGHLMRVADAGIYLPDAGTTSSALNYLYAYSNTDSDGIVSGAGNHGGLIQLTITHSETAGAQVTMSCFSIGGAYQANGYWSGTVIDGTHIDLIGSSSAGLGTYTPGTGQCRLLSLKASTTVPVIIGNGVQSMTGDSHYALVGYSNVAGAHSVTNTFSTYNGTASHNGLALSCSDLVFGAGAGSGPSPTCTSVTGDDRKFRVLFTTGGAPTASAIVFTITFKTAWTTAPICTMAFETTLSIAKSTAVFPTPTTTTLVLTSTVGNLAVTTAYDFAFQCMS